MNNMADIKAEESHFNELNASDVENLEDNTLFYIAVEYVKDDKLIDITPASQDTFGDFATPQVSPLDPNMGSVAPYSPFSVQYQEPVVIHRFVNQNGPGQDLFVNNNGILESLSSDEILCDNNDLPQVEPQYLDMMQSSSVNLDDSRLPVNGEQQEVELLITDHATGISYSVNAQELLVANNDPILDLGSDLFSIDNSDLKVGGSQIDCNVNESPDLENGRVNTRSCSGARDKEEELLSCVYSISDKPVLTKARASLPESYLSITQFNEEEGVVAKKRIPIRTQFGPLKGLVCSSDEPSAKSYRILIKDCVQSIDLSDENNSNWMAFVRKAQNYQEQNLILTQEEGALYFTSTRNINPKEELKVGYSSAYARQFDLATLKAIDEKSWPCYECSEKFIAYEELVKHLNVHDSERDENRRPKRKNRKLNSLFKKSQFDLVECNQCHDLFMANTGYNTLKAHLIEKHKFSGGIKIGEQFSMLKCFQCTVCHMRFKMETLLNIHKLEHDSELPLDQPNHVCPGCQRKFPTRKQLILHVPSHSLMNVINKDNSVKCPVCHKAFAHSIRLQTHMLCHGSDENKPVQCDTCKKRFLTASALAFHEKIHKVGEKHFQCPICNERFDHVLKLRLHIPEHARNNTYACPHCEKVFGKYNIIRKHIKFHSERRFQCEECAKSFYTLDHLKKHMLRHSDHREFLCANCGKQFKRKDKLGEHIRKLHLQPESRRRSKGARGKVAGSVSAKEPTDFHRFIFKCHTCLVGFKRRGMLVNHLAKRHPDIRPDSVPELNLPILQTLKDYHCQYCDKVYKSSSKRKVHILKNHPGAALPSDNGQKSQSSMSFSTTGSVTTRPKKCQWCHRQYARKCKLIQHIRKAHPLKISEEELQAQDQEKSSTTTVCAAATKPEMDFKEELLKSQITTDGNMTEITPAVIEGLIDDDSKYCHLSIDENGEIDNHNAQFYQLLTAGSGKNLL